MKCEEFRTRMVEGGSEENELEQHIGNCLECSAWLERELSEPPQGLTPAQWQAATARCFPESLPQQQPETPAEPIQPVTFWNSYVNGMTYGLVFGLSIVFGFALLQLRNSSVEEPPRTPLAQISFVEDSERELPIFCGENRFDVTFLQDGDSEMVSFVEYDDEIKFLDYSEEENL